MLFLVRYVMRGRSQAALILTTVTLLTIIHPLFALLSGSFIALINLTKPWIETILVLLIATAAVYGFSELILPRFADASGTKSVGTIAMTAVPILICSGLVKRYQRLDAGIYAGLFVVLAVTGVFLSSLDGSSVDYWQPQIERLLERAQQGELIQGATAEQLQETAARFATIATAANAAGGFTGIVVCLLLARWWQSQMVHPGGFGSEYRSLRYPWYLLLVLGITVILSVIGPNDIVQSVLLMIFCLYAFSGFAVIHALSYKRNWQFAALAALYTSLFVLPTLILFVIILGLFDQFFNFRKFANQEAFNA